MISVIATCIAIVIVVLVAAFIIGAVGGIILGTARRMKKSPLKSIIVLILIGVIISSVSKYKKVEAEPPQQAITPAQTQQVAISKNQPPIICTQTQKVNNPPPTNTLHRRIEIHVYGDYNITEIVDVIYRKMDTRPNAPLIEKNIITGSDSSVFADIEWKDSMPNPPEIKSTVDEIIDMSQNLDSEQKEQIRKLLARMQKPTSTRIDHDTLNKPKPLSVETNQQCIERTNVPPQIIANAQGREILDMERNKRDAEKENIKKLPTLSRKQQEEYMQKLLMEAQRKP